MKGYTIQNSIDLLEKNAGNGSGGSTTAANVIFDNTGTGIVATNVQGAIEEINEKLPEYKTTEQIVGKWIDGTDLYSTTVSISALPSTTETFVDYPHSIANVDKIVEINGVVDFGNDIFAPLPYAVAGLISGQIGIRADKTNIGIMVGVDRSSASAYVTLKYTKAITGTKKTRRK